jgi:Ca2+/H+ antiporter, TMEM165/GDT1 family
MALVLIHTGATRLGTTVVAAFLASLVECVEALTVVLAVGSVRGWRSALAGAGAALAVLGAIVAALGPALSRIPLHLIQLVVGTMILLFGLRWLRKAILRAAGLIPLHDEAAAFEKNAAAMHGAEIGATGQFGRSDRSFDKLAFAAAFNITMLEGTEVVFLVIALGAGAAGLLHAASLGAAAALVVVAALGVALHRPLARVPENTLKFIVGVLLSAFGTFWVSEGAGFGWPGVANPDLVIPVLMAAYLALALGLVPCCRTLAAVEG